LPFQHVGAVCHCDRLYKHVGRKYLKLATNTWRLFEYFRVNSDNVNAAFEVFKTLIRVSHVTAFNDG